MPSSLSPAQAEILDHYRIFIIKQGRSPSISEVAKALKRERSNIHYHITNLERMGYVVRTGGHRGVRIVNQPSKIIPLMGIIAYGESITIFEEITENIQVPENMLLDGYAHYALRAKGNSMIKAGIRNGDILIIRKQANIQDGEVAVIATDQSPFEAATIKRAFHKTEDLLLKPENDELDSCLIKKGEVQGKLVGLLRNM